MEPRLREAKAGRRVVLFVDASHFVFGAFLGCLWTLIRHWVRSPSGRKRVNVLGALDAITHRMITVVNDSYINAESVCELLRKIAKRYAGRPITLFLDNARYQHCALVQDLATSLQIELQFLPSYSPNLNLIERFWKFTKKCCLYSKHYSDFESFRTAILDCVNNAPRRNKTELDSLLALNFQSFEEPQFLTV